jgi:hypothetical protein
MERPRLTLKQAAAACGVSLSTIRRRHERGEFPNAEKDVDGTWQIPVPDLLAAGLRVNAPAPPDPSTANEGTDGRLAQALVELDRERERRQFAEEKNRLLLAHLDDMRTAMRALTPGPPSDTEQPHDDAQNDDHDQAVNVPEQPRRRTWSWRR